MSDIGRRRGRGLSAPGERLKTLVLLCQALEDLGSGLDLAEVKRWFQETDTAVRVEAVTDLCHRPGEVSRLAASGAARLVLGLCSEDYGELEMQSHARRAGLDPLGVAVANLGGYCATVHPRPQGTDKAKLLLAAAVARARAFPGSSPEGVRPYLVRGHQKVSRRGLFTLPPIGYRAVVSLQSELCISEAGCQLCVEVCPRGALTKVDGRLSLDKGRCEACGLCVVACPCGAPQLPTHSLPQLEAEITALLQNPALEPSQPRAVLFVCQGNAAALAELGGRGLSYPVGWLPLQVPCAGMVSAAWLLQCLALGAAAVGVVDCGGDCPFGQRELIEGRVAYCRELLGLLGGSPDAMQLLPAASAAMLAQGLSGPLKGGARRRDRGLAGVSLSSPRAAAQALQALAHDYGASPTFSLPHPYSPLGLVRIDADKCTGCGACTWACPTGALALQQENGAVALTFDPALCNGCGQCSNRCPETPDQVVRVAKVTDLQALSRGRVTLYQDQEVRCQICGAVIGPAAMLRRIEALLGDKGGASAATLAAITQRCPACRGAGPTGGSHLIP